MDNIGVDICDSSNGNTELHDIEMGDKTPMVFLKILRAENEGVVIIAHLNIEALKSLVENKIDVLVIAETKIDESFPPISNRRLFYLTQSRQKSPWWGITSICARGHSLQDSKM